MFPDPLRMFCAIFRKIDSTNFFSGPLKFENCHFKVSDQAFWPPVGSNPGGDPFCQKIENFRFSQIDSEMIQNDELARFIHSLRKLSVF